jgi:hypothetical protein
VGLGGVMVTVTITLYRGRVINCCAMVFFLVFCPAYTSDFAFRYKFSASLSFLVHLYPIQSKSISLSLSSALICRFPTVRRVDRGQSASRRFSNVLA